MKTGENKKALSEKGLKLGRVALMAALLSSSAFVPLSHANPEGGQVVGGAATISESGKKLDVHQHTDRTVIDWRSFNIDVDEHTEFHQPSSSATALNRVKSADPSQILGKLTANGNIVLVNPNGVFFGRDSVVDVNGLVATTADIDTNAFMAGGNHFNIPGKPDASIVNEGTITAKDAGLVGLVAPNVENHGIIKAKMGRVQLASGDTVVADFYGDGLLKVEVTDDNVKSQFVGNTGKLEAEGGTVAMTAAAARQTVNSLIVAKGELKAPSVSKRGGKIIIGAGGSNKTDKGGASGVIVQASLDASGRNEGEQGGAIEVLGDHIAILDGTVMDASGHASLRANEESAAIQSDSALDRHGSDNPRDDDGGTATLTEDKQVRSEEEFMADTRRAGGSIKIGGDYLGGGDTQTAKTLYVGESTLTLNNAIDNGDAGRTIFWSDDTTEFNGLVLAMGGENGGNGGFLETSGKINLLANGFADLSAQADGYAKGTYLLDPQTITVYGDSFGTIGPGYVSTDGTSIDLATGLALWLDANDMNTVKLTYTATELGGAVASGIAGTNTITTDIDVSSWLKAGSRIRLGSAGVETAASTLGADTYTIVSVVGTTITVQQNLTANYTNQALNRGLVSTWNDKSLQGNTATQGTASARPLFTESGNIGGNAVFTDGINDGMFVLDLDDDLIIQQGVNSGLYVSSVWYGLGVGNKDWNGNATVGGQATGVLGKNGNTNYTGAKSFAIGTSNDGNDLFLRVNTQSTLGPGNFVNSSNAYESTYLNTSNIFDYELVSDGVTSFTLNEYIQGKQVDSDSLITDNPLDQNYKAGDNFVFGARHLGNDAYAPVQYSEMLAFSKDLSNNERDLLNQYQSAKWGIALDKLAGAGTEIAEATAHDAGDPTNAATNGYNVFTTRYLERLAGSADLLLQASDSITLDLKGDTLDLTGGAAAGKSITLQSDNGDITDVSSGTIRTTKTGSGAGLNGNIALIAGGAGNINLDTTTLDAQNGGQVSLTAGGRIDLTHAGALNLGTVSGETVNIRTTGASDVTLNNTITATDSGNALTIASGRNFINNAGAGALNTTDINGRWLVYSADPSANTLGGLSSDFKRYNKTYAGYAPGSVVETGDGLLYSIAPTLNITADNQTRNFGQSNPALTYTTSGLIDSDILTDALGALPTLTTSAGQNSVAGSYPITGSFISALGYTINFTPGTLTVNPLTSLPSNFEGVAFANDGLNLSQDSAQNFILDYASPSPVPSQITFTIAQNDSDRDSENEENNNPSVRRTQGQQNDKNIQTPGMNVTIEAALARTLGLTQEKIDEMFQ